MIKQVRETLHGGSKGGTQKFISECQDLSHSVVKEAEHLRVQELVQRIENHLHREALHADLQPAKIRKRFANWVMWSYSSCAKLHNQKYNVLTVFSIGIKELCIALADIVCFTENPEDISTDLDWMHSLSRTM